MYTIHRKIHLHRLVGSGTDPKLLLSLIIVLLLFVGATLFGKAQGSVTLNRIGMKFGRNILKVNTYPVLFDGV